MTENTPTSTEPEVPAVITSWKSPDTYFHLVSALISALVLSEVFVPGSMPAKVVGCIALALQFLGYNAGRARGRVAVVAAPK